MLLSIDGTQPHFSWCLMDQEQVIASESLRLSHYEQLPDYLQSQFKKNDLKPENIERLAVIIGPGNYTGLRTSLSFIRTWHMLYKTPVVCKNRLETMLYALASQKVNETVWISQFVRMQQYFIIQAKLSPKDSEKNGDSSVASILSPLEKVDEATWKTNVKDNVYGEAPSDCQDTLKTHSAWGHLSPVLAQWAEKETHFSSLNEMTPFYTRAAVAK